MNISAFFRGRIGLLVLISCSGTLAPFQLALSQQEELEEVLVTAQKRAENLQDVGISVVAVSGAEIRNSGISDNIDALVKIPNVANESPYGPGTSANIVIRGIGLNDFGEGHEAPVTAYVDEFYLLAIPSVQFSMFDLERLEVLRGPQGTLFGRNATAGLVQYVSTPPGKDPSAFVQLSAGSFGERKVEAAGGAPLTENLAFRLSLVSDKSDGYVRNVNPAIRPGGQNGTKAIRAQLRYDKEGFRLAYKAEYGELDARQVYYGSIPGTFLPNGLLVNDPAGVDSGGYNQRTFNGGAAAGPNVSYTNFPSHQSVHTTTQLLRVEKDFGDLTFTSLTGYLNMARHLQEDCDGSPNDFCRGFFPYSTHYYTQELRLAKLSGATRWTAGLYWLDATGKSSPHSVFFVPVDDPAPLDPATHLYAGVLFPYALSTDWTLKTRSVSVFGQAERDLGDRWTLIAGVRATRDRKSFVDPDNAALRQCDDQVDYPAGGCLTDYTPTPYRGSYAGTLYSGKLALELHVTDTVMTYGSLSRGTKAGGFNNGFISANFHTLDRIPYEAETNVATELGVKMTVLNGRLRLNADVFNYNYRNFQAFNYFAFGGIVVNRDAVSRGGEMELTALLAPRLEATLNLAGLNTRVDNITLPDGATTVDREMASSPHFSGGATLKYSLPLGSAGSAVFTWDGNYTGAYYTDLVNDPASRVNGYFLHNARLSYSPDPHWEFAVAMNNISDRQVAIRPFVFSSLRFSQQLYAKPRTTLGQILYKW